MVNPPMDRPRALARAITKQVSIDRDVSSVFAFVANLANWPRFAIVNVKSVSKRPGEDWWDMITPRGAARLRIRPVASLGILDHDFVDPQASWTVPARVVPNGAEAELSMTLFQPPGLTDEECDAQMKLMDVELVRLEEILEAERT